MIGPLARNLARLFRKSRTARPAPTPEAQMELVEHLAELRTRLFRMLLYLAVGMILTYNFSDQIYSLLEHPIHPFVSTMLFTNIADPFILKMQICFIAGITAAFPFITLEIWGFIEPALTEEERKPVQFLAPFSVLLFLAGVATAYAALPACYGWMAQFISSVPNGTLYQDPKIYILLTAKIMLAFGVGFELPVLLLFLARIGLITADWMTTYWRHATVGIAVAAAILTPSNDPLTMLMMAVPMAGLYLLSIGLVRAFEPKDGKTEPPMSALLLTSLAPVAIIIAASFWLWRTHAFATLPNAPKAVDVQKQVEANEAKSVKSFADVETRLQKLEKADADKQAKLDADEKEIAELRARVEALEAGGAQPATPDVPSTPDGTATPDGTNGGAAGAAQP